MLLCVLFFLGTDFTDDTVFSFCCCTKIQAPQLLLHTILRRGVDFSCYPERYYLTAFSGLWPEKSLGDVGKSVKLVFNILNL